MKLIIICLILSLSVLHADGEEIAKSLNLSPGTKAMLQWERVFTSKRKMKRYKIDKLSSKEKEELQMYLINHAIDSDQPTIAGV